MWKGREIPAWYLKGTKRSSRDKLVPLKQISPEQQQQQQQHEQQQKQQQQHSSSATSVAPCEKDRGRSVEIENNNRCNQNNTLNDNSGVTVGENDRHILTGKDCSSGEKRGKYKKSKKAHDVLNSPHKPSVINNPDDQTGVRSPSVSSSDGSPEKCNSSGDSVRGSGANNPGIRPRPSFSPAVPPIVMVS